jgi:NAD(P)-dependent dehydrogenase (short-subunit alcohol dehydrogenase family)
VLQINTIGPMLMAKHFAPQLLRRGEATMFASISARVGSIGDNVMGGWYSYRASKAAQNQFTKTLSIELQRRSKGGCAVIGLHPGTVRTALSAPFAKNVQPDKLFEPEHCAEMLVSVMERVLADPKAMTGRLYDYSATPIEW